MSIPRWSIAAWTSALASRRPTCCVVIRITWSTSSTRCRRTRPDSSCATPGRRSMTSARAASCRCWSVARCSTSVHCAVDFADMPAADPACGLHRRRAALRGWPAMHAELAALDPAAARRIQPNDAQRIQRALEVHRLTGKTLRSCTPRSRPMRISRSPRMRGCRAIASGCMRRSNSRFHAMMRAGLLEEVRKLHARGDLHAGSSRDTLRRIPPAVGTFERPRRFGLCNAAGNFRDAPTGAAATDLAARRVRNTAGSTHLIPSAGAHNGARDNATAVATT